MHKLAEAEQQKNWSGEEPEIERDNAKTKDIRLKAMRKLKDAKKRQSDGMEDNSK